MRRCGRFACSNVIEDGGDDVGIFDAGNHLELAAALRAGFYVDCKYPFQALHPRHRCKGLGGLYVVGFGLAYDALTMLAVRGEYAMETGEVEPGTRDQCGEAGNEIEWLEDDVGRVI